MTTLPIPVSSALTAAQQTSVLNLMRRAARAEVLPRFRDLTAEDIRQKSHANDLVTEADTAAEAMIGRGLARLFPGALIVGEEAVARDPGLRDKIHEADLAFIIDPVDGTWNYVHGLPLFGMILAVTRFGVPVFGALYDPLQDDVIVAEENGPAMLLRPAGQRRTLSVSQGGALSDLSGYLHLHLMPEDKRAETAATLPDFGRALMLRCSCHEYRTVAQGGMDFCLSGVLNPWDHAAGVLICQRAGGHVAMLDGRDYNTSIRDGYLLAASNADTWARLRDRFAFLLE